MTRRLMMVPGVERVTRLPFAATIDGSRRLNISIAVGAPLGLTPRVYRSGEVDRSGQISNRGDRTARVWRCFRNADDLVAFVAPLLSRGLTSRQRRDNYLPPLADASADLDAIPPPHLKRSTAAGGG